jgi:hypothetical protein
MHIESSMRHVVSDYLWQARSALHVVRAASVKTGLRAGNMKFNTQE